MGLTQLLTKLKQKPTILKACQKSSKSCSDDGEKWNHSMNTWYGRKQMKKITTKEITIFPTC
ncbi:hypothetical protein K0M31_009540 [Melipona bicolor]|uniref:Uncharacterized protein n=1 Tax=Melipona bicolor TaxID=60889 RepID=A0AA40FNA4_9HYME|nr:hypothetical protein K0M31_009540 [Melipona bicolor]